MVDSTRYTRLPVAGAVKVTGWVTREPSGMVRVVLPDAMTVPVGLSSRAVQVKPTEVLVKSSLNTVMLRVTVAVAGVAGHRLRQREGAVGVRGAGGRPVGQVDRGHRVERRLHRWICGLLQGSGRLSAP